MATTIQMPPLKGDIAVNGNYFMIRFFICCGLYILSHSPVIVERYRKAPRPVFHVDEADKSDYFRFNVHLREIPNAIDSVEAMDDYRNLVILQAGSGALARDAAIAFLISRLYFVVEAVPETGDLPLSCRGTVRWEALGVDVKPSEVRLKFGEDEVQYAWKFNNKNLEPLFEKHLSKHSVGAYMQLHREAGKGFYAVNLKDIPKNTPQLDITEQLSRLETKKADLALRLAKAEQRILALNATRVQHKEMISTQKNIIQEAQASISFYKQDIQKWMLKVDIYEKSYI
ncbi:hypothetical protein IFM53868_02400 [Aspergillus udagawae]|uniref:Uncharacterized protein n=1 Tax=Aspergillus udagawae TaxID=91492 RepID=A0ABQ1AC96_9EURO|nr:hypothetical protein IFM53868_02400 [Aspergillus udagawae]